MNKAKIDALNTFRTFRAATSLLIDQAETLGVLCGMEIEEEADKIAALATLMKLRMDDLKKVEDFLID